MVLMERAGSAPIGDERQLVELMASYQNGDLAAFEQLYAALADEVRRFFERQQRGAARDLLQEAFLELHRSRRTYRPGLPVRPWVYGIARNVLARDRRMLAHDVRAQRSFADPATLAARASAPPAETIDVEKALAGLPRSTREPWLLHHVLGLSFQAIARRLGITVIAAKLRSSRASRALREALR